MEISLLIADANATDYISAFCAVITTGLAIWGLTTWRHQLKGGAEYLLAKDLLKATYRTGKAFDRVRNPVIRSNEYPEAMQEDAPRLEAGPKHVATMYVYDQRWKQMAEALDLFREKSLDAQVEWGRDFDKLTRPLLELAYELRGALNFMLWPNPGEDSAFDPNAEGSKERIEARKSKDRIIYKNDLPEFDDFTPKIEAAIANLERALRAKIGKKVPVRML